MAILIRMIHDVRIIPLDLPPHLGSGIRQWMGDSRGRWEGQTLVVETTNFNDKIQEVSANAMRLPSGEPLGGRYHAVFGTAGLKLGDRSAVNGLRAPGFELQEELAESASRSRSL